MLRYCIYNGATPKESPQLPLAFFYFSLSLSNTPLLAIRDIHSEWPGIAGMEYVGKKLICEYSGDILHTL